MNILINPSSIHNAIAGLVHLNTELLQSAMDHSSRQSQQVETLTKAIASVKSGDAKLRELCTELCEVFRQAEHQFVQSGSIGWPIGDLRDIVTEISKLVEPGK